MYAVFRSGGKQYRASEGERLRVEKLDLEEGADVSFDEVLLVGEGKDIQVGQAHRERHGRQCQSSEAGQES